jgi:TM2 domain-containing membrane protein YozV
MSRRFKAVLLSAFVLPGLGQLYRGRRLKGGILIAMVNIFILAALFLAMRGLGKLMLAGQVAGSLESGKVLEAIQQDSPAGRWLLAAFCGLWLYSVVDAVLDRKADGEQGN